MLAGHLKVLGGPHVARGPDVAQACLRRKKVFIYYLFINYISSYTSSAILKQNLWIENAGT